MKCEKSGSHTISYQSLLLSTIVLNESIIVLNDKNVHCSQPPLKLFVILGRLCNL